jgi:N-carbamoyl-L-amino-acid hydrolase
MGSHLDSVMRGGNYDGAAGVVAGLVVVAAMRDMGAEPQSDVTAMGIRAEEGDWFGLNHVGTRAALGLLTGRELDAKRVDTGRRLEEHMAEVGCDLTALHNGARALDPAALTAYFELHIEQGPVLELAGLSVGVVTGIRGNVRAHDARCLGDYAHSGAVPMHLRRDAVMATAELVQALRGEWRTIDTDGGDLVLTFGKLHTDLQVHQLSKVPGEVRFTIDARSIDRTILDRMAERIAFHAERITETGGARFDLGHIALVEPAHMAQPLVDDLKRRAADLGIAAMVMASGAGHDAADFARAGVPTAMVFVRNRNSSHNPAEDMSLEDFCLGTELLADSVAAAAGSDTAMDDRPT